MASTKTIELLRRGGGGIGSTPVSTLLAASWLWQATVVDYGSGLVLIEFKLGSHGSAGLVWFCSCNSPRSWALFNSFVNSVLSFRCFDSSRLRFDCFDSAEVAWFWAHTLGLWLYGFNNSELSDHGIVPLVIDGRPGGN